MAVHNWRLATRFSCYAMLLLITYTDGRTLLTGRTRSTYQHDLALDDTDGDIIFSVLLPIHMTSINGTCSEVYVDGLVLVEATVFALREIRRQKLLPEGVTLGYNVYDTCSSVAVAQRQTLGLVIKTMDEGQTLSKTSGKLIAVVGAGNSRISLAVNRFLNALSIPQIGFASTSRYLSDKSRFSSFFRTVPPDSFQVKAIVGLFQRLSWNYAGLLFSDGGYGRPLAEAFKDMAKIHGICIGFEHVIPEKNMTKIDMVIQDLRSKSKLDVIVILVPEQSVKNILNSMLKNNLVNKTLIASDSWSLSSIIRAEKYKQLLRGTLGFTHYRAPIKQFEKYFGSLTPNTNTWNRWFNKTWEHIFNCKIRVDDDVKNKSHVNKCNIKQQHLHKEQFPKFRYALHLINAVFSIAYGVRQFCQNFSKNTVLNNSYNSCLSAISPEKLTKQLFRMKFRGFDGPEIVFDKNGDVEGRYELINILPDLSHQTVGVWKGSTLRGNFSNVWWNSVNQSAPKGVCTQPCLPGWFKVSLNHDPQCCWKCQRCLEGTISNTTNAIACYVCDDNSKTNYKRTMCVNIPIDYFSWKSSLAVTVAVVALIAIFLLFFVAILFVRFSNTPVVKSSNRELSFLLCLGLFVTFLVPFVFAGKPTRRKCTTSILMFCIGSALALSSMLFKTLRIVLVFESSRRRWFLENKYEVALAIALTLVELIYCLLWMIFNPPNVVIIPVKHNERYLACKFDKYWYAGSHVLLIVLSLLCTGLAVRGRNLPKNFNEIKHITLSMFTFNIVWVVFTGAQYGASIGYDSRINCFAMIISSLMILILLFGPKAFLLLFRPHLNRPEEFQHEVSRYSFHNSNINIVNTSNKSSTGTLSMGSSRHVIDPTKHQFLTIPNDVDFKRKRAYTVDSALPTERYPQKPRKDDNVKCQSLDNITVTKNQHLRNEQQNSRKNTSISVLITQSDEPSNTSKMVDSLSKIRNRNQKKSFLHGNLHKQRTTQNTRCEVCHQSIKKKPFSLSLPNIVSKFSEEIDVDIHEKRPRDKLIKNDALLNFHETLSIPKISKDKETEKEENPHMSEVSPLIISIPATPPSVKTKNKANCLSPTMTNDQNVLAKFKNKMIRETDL